MAERFSRRRLLETLAGLPLVSALGPGASAAARTQARVRPGDPAWPSDESWAQLGREVEGVIGGRGHANGDTLASADDR